jgi:hypothetical protein
MLDVFQQQVLVLPVVLLQQPARCDCPAALLSPAVRAPNARAPTQNAAQPGRTCDGAQHMITAHHMRIRPPAPADRLWFRIVPPLPLLGTNGLAYGQGTA